MTFAEQCAALADEAVVNARFWLLVARDSTGDQRTRALDHAGNEIDHGLRRCALARKSLHNNNGPTNP